MAFAYGYFNVTKTDIHNDINVGEYILNHVTLFSIFFKCYFETFVNILLLVYKFITLFQYQK